MHEKKAKGDLAVAKVIARLTELGWNVGVLITERAAYDLLAEKLGQVIRVQVRHAALRGDVLIAELGNSWADRNGSHSKKREPGRYDVLALFSTATNQTYFVRDEQIGSNARGLSLRLVPSKNNQALGIRWADDHLVI
jgi:hypothetical protein